MSAAGRSPGIIEAAGPEQLLPGAERLALLFDWDGTLFDNHGFNSEVLRAALAEAGAPVSADWFHQNSGFSASDMVELAAEAARVRVDVSAVLARRDELADARVAEVPVVAPVFGLLERFRGRLLLGVVTGSNRSNIAALLREHGLGDTFDVVVTREQLTAGKPDPEGYLAALALLGVEPARALVYEDSEQGVRAALAAGIDVVDVRPLLADTAAAERGPSGVERGHPRRVFS